MKKIFYVLNVDWNWIKQRPQFVAEGLSKLNNVLVAYRYKYNRKNLTIDKNINKVHLSRIYTIPFINNKKMAKINERLFQFAISSKINKFKPDYIYLTNPSQYEGLHLQQNVKIIYDCMDYHHAFIEDEKERKKLQSFEKKLVHDADLIIVSSEKLKENLILEYSLEVENDKIKIIRNGYDGKILETAQYGQKGEKFIITYIGTISHWFDLDIILKSLEDFVNIEFQIVGPISKTQVVNDERIHYLGSVPHESLENIVKESSLLIMPFKVNEIVEAVDPVKLYEYINFNKNILSVKYKEIERFEDFVYFYTNYEEFKENLERLLKNNTLKYSDEDRRRFLKENSWEKRVEAIEELLNNL